MAKVRRFGVGLGVYTSGLVGGWLAAAYLLAAVLGDWVALHFWLFVSVWALCAIGLSPIVAHLLRVPVSVFLGRVSADDEIAIPPTLSRSLRSVVLDARMLRLSLQSETGEIAPYSHDLWQWTTALDRLDDADKEVLTQLGLRADPIRRVLLTQDEARPTEAQAQSRRTTVIEALRHFESSLLRHRPAVYR